MRFSDKVVLITGGAGGIGRVTAREFCKEGARVAIADYDKIAAEKFAGELKAEGFTAESFIVDVTDNTQVENCVKAVADTFGKIDVLVSLAGGSARKDRAFFYEQDIAVFKRIMEINLYGDFYFARACAKYMIKAGYGRIINTGSVVGMNGHVKHVEYSAAKGGTIAMTKSMAKEVGKYGITVNCVSPGMIPTANATGGDLGHTNYLGITPSPYDIAAGIMYLASDDAKFITGFNLVIDGGRSLATRGTE